MAGERKNATTWGAVYSRRLKQGHDHGSAAYVADQWEKRQDPMRWSRCPSTHCERSQECRSPNECSAKLNRPDPTPTLKREGQS